MTACWTGQETYQAPFLLPYSNFWSETRKLVSYQCAVPYHATRAPASGDPTALYSTIREEVQGNYRWEVWARGKWIGDAWRIALDRMPRILTREHACVFVAVHSVANAGLGSGLPPLARTVRATSLSFRWTVAASRDAKTGRRGGKAPRQELRLPYDITSCSLLNTDDGPGRFSGDMQKCASAARRGWSSGLTE